MKKTLLFIITLFVVLFSACNTSKKADDAKELNLAMVNWIECIANAHLTKAVLEERGYNVNLINAEVALVFSAVATGDADVFMEVWEPITHKSYLEKYGSKVEDLGSVYDNGQLGIVVPHYVDINSIDELQAHKEKFDGKITGINPGAGIMGITESVIKDYELDFELVQSSEAGMLAALKKAYDKKEWIAVTGWKPHTKFARFDLKILDDPKGTMGAVETISVIATKGWSEKNPELATFFRNFKMNDELLGSLMIKIEENSGNETAAAKEWYMEHKDLVDSWFE
ncbi:glycine betaine/proline transport system substrate-binding protein [Saccharicrinis carchari]|uniref:Glycine betaine/proline transport system substrate-binding protein n=1 Tax=Saccharicrinis carchari TaxID=1168039 RepID=A0A521AWZ2_SACCC|nr:glycine betaine ABC transporter substrate-binding protein [Saccharicrinis carchari]SMO39294.1 glycine betaine/proline transport system substrate-binding protein [Saccharicrinis carchari]